MSEGWELRIYRYLRGTGGRPDSHVASRVVAKIPSKEATFEVLREQMKLIEDEGQRVTIAEITSPDGELTLLDLELNPGSEYLPTNPWHYARQEWRRHLNAPDISLAIAAGATKWELWEVLMEALGDGRVRAVETVTYLAFHSFPKRDAAAEAVGDPNPK